MLDFLQISEKSPKRGVVEIYPSFLVKKSKDLMIRGREFYAVWDDSTKLWSKDEFRAIEIIDREVEKAYQNYIEERGVINDIVRPLYLRDADSGMIDKWIKYTERSMRDNYVPLDENIIFSNEETTRESYASVKLPYPLEGESHKAWDNLVSVLYSPEERHKIEWIIGAIAKGDSKKLQKFVVFYGSGGTGKSTILNIIDKMFEGYSTTFDAKALSSANSSFSLEPFNSNPLVAIDHDSKLDKIEDNTRINSLVSHEKMVVNEKHKRLYKQAFNCILLIGTNSPVKITDAKSGIIRRLIDISPTGDLIPRKEYDKLMKDIQFELGGIVKYCTGIYESDPNYYDDYIPISMIGSTNHFYDYVLDEFNVFSSSEGVTLSSAWESYKLYCENANINYPMNRLTFKEELKNYFEVFYDRTFVDGKRIRNYYEHFLTSKFESPKEQKEQKEINTDWIRLEDGIISQFDVECSECDSQYANEDDKPRYKWSDEKHIKKLKELLTNRVHYIRVPINHIVIDFDLKDSDGKKSLQLNLEAANQWPQTYCEVSKGGQGLHLHYIYTGDPEKLERIYSKDIEIKVFTGSSALRRKLTQCNDIPISTISSGLPLRKEKILIDDKKVKSERELKAKIAKALLKGYDALPGTKTNIDFIDHILNQAYESGIPYDITTMRPDIMQFASNSTNHADYCMKKVAKMKFKSETEADVIEFPSDAPQVIFDCEVLPNLFVICWKKKGPGNKFVRMINPSADEVRKLFKMRLRGFNCRRYDNHIIFAASEGYTNKELFDLSQKIINKSPNCFFSIAYGISEYDIYDGASAMNKKSLKKYEIEINNLMKMKKPDQDKNPELYSKWEKVQEIMKKYKITELKHKELDLPWDKDVDPKDFETVADYCCNDVLATEIVDEYLTSDYIAREILADIVNHVHPDMAKSTVNDTTNTLSTRLIFGSNRHPQDEFYYRDLAEPVENCEPDLLNFLWNDAGLNMGEKNGSWKPRWKKDAEYSILPYFPGYTHNGKSLYRGYEVGEGGFVWAKPGIYYNVRTFDIASMHPSSAIAECLFGRHYTKVFLSLKTARLYIKHKDWDNLAQMFDGVFVPYIQKIESGEISAKDLSNALKTVINSVYGLTAASFENPFRDPRNVDNIVAKRGALFMVDLLEACLEKGWEVVHIKTDSIKIANATDEMNDFIIEFGKYYGYEFEIESEYERMCLVNDAVYIAKTQDGYWTATGKQFQVPYVFKTLFSHEEIDNSDLAEVFNVQTALYLDFNEGLKEDEHSYNFVGRTGAFYPIKPGFDAGELYRIKDDHYYYPSGAKGYRWKETEIIDTLNLHDQIDMTYWDSKVEEAIRTICKFENCDDFFPEPIDVIKEVA